MKNYIRVATGISDEEAADVIKVCAAEMPERDLAHHGFSYPGITISKSMLDILMPTISRIADLALAKSKWPKVTYDLGLGTGVNFLHLKEYDLLPRHADLPLHEVDANFQIKPDYLERKCVLTVVLGLSSSHKGGEFSLIDPKTGVATMLELNGQAVVYRSEELQSEIAAVTEGEAYFITAYLCSNK